LAAAGRELNVVLAGPDSVGEGLNTRESMWRVMVEWASYQYVRSEESMVVTLFELLAVYGVQVRSRGSLVEEATGIILDGLVEVLKERGVQRCSAVLPGSAGIRGGKEFARLTNTVSGVAVVLRVSLLLWSQGGDEESIFFF